MNLANALKIFNEKRGGFEILVDDSDHFLEMIINRFCPVVNLVECDKIIILHERKELRSEDNVWCVYFSREFSFPLNLHNVTYEDIILVKLFVTEDKLFDFIKSSITNLKVA